MAISEEIRNVYFNALYNAQFGNNEPLKQFKDSFPDAYRTITNTYHARVKLRHDLNVMKRISNNRVYWGTLTYNETKDLNQKSTKLKDAEKHLNELFGLWLLVEEYGRDNDRYHIHFIGVFKENKTFEDFFKWHSREDIQKVYRSNKVARYLCDYINKDIPRIRRNKTLIKYSKQYKNTLKMSKIGFKLSADSTIKTLDFLSAVDLQEGC